MKKLIIIAVFSFLYSQASSLAIQGLGEVAEYHDAASAALGKSVFFSGNHNGLCQTSISSLWRSPLTRFSVTSSFDIVETDILPAQESQYFRNLSFTFPIGKEEVVSIGLQPYTRTDYFIHEPLGSNPNVNYGNQYYTSRSFYHGEGGLAELYAAYSARATENFSLGLKWNIQFGTLTQSDTVFTYMVSTNPETGEISYGISPVDVTIFQSNNRFNGHSIQLEGRYVNGKHEFAASAVLRPQLKIVSQTYYTGLGSGPDDEVSADFSFRSLGTGYKYDTGKASGVLAEFNWFNAEALPNGIDLFQNSPGEKIRLSMGAFRRFSNPRITAWDAITARAGWFYTHSGDPTLGYDDYGITLGIGIDYLNYKNSLDLGLVLGQRNSDFDEFKTENYLSLVVGFATGENWFVKRKRE